MHPRSTNHPITPAEARQLHDVDPAEANRIIGEVSEALKAYDGTRTVSLAADKLGRVGKVRDAVLAAFEAAGWRVKFHADQRDGDWYFFGE